MTQELNSNTEKLQKQSNESSANNSPSSEKQSSANDAPWLDCMDGFKYSEPSDSDQEPEGEVDKWRSEGRGYLFF